MTIHWFELVRSAAGCPSEKNPFKDVPQSPSKYYSSSNTHKFQINSIFRSKCIPFVVEEEEVEEEEVEEVLGRGGQTVLWKLNCIVLGKQINCKL